VWKKLIPNAFSSQQASQPAAELWMIWANKTEVGKQMECDRTIKPFFKKHWPS